MRTDPYTNPNDGDVCAELYGDILYEVRAFGVDLPDAFRSHSLTSAIQFAKSLIGQASFSSVVNSVWLNGTPFRVEEAVAVLQATLEQRAAEWALLDEWLAK